MLERNLPQKTEIRLQEIIAKITIKQIIESAIIKRSWSILGPSLLILIIEKEITSAPNKKAIVLTTKAIIANKKQSSITRINIIQIFIIGIGWSRIQWPLRTRRQGTSLRSRRPWFLISKQVSIDGRNQTTTFENETRALRNRRWTRCRGRCRESHQLWIDWKITWRRVLWRVDIDHQ